MNDSDGYRQALDSLRSRTSEIREVPVSQLGVDNRFQRPLNMNAVKMIHDGYHPQGLGYLLVAHILQDDGTLSREWSVIDGQTRWRGIEELRHEGKPVPDTVKVEAFDELTAEEAAALFGLRNGQKPVPPAERARVLMYAGDPVLREIVEAAAAVGLIVFRDDPDNDPQPTMPHITEARRIHTWGAKCNRPDLLGLSLSIQAQAFGTNLGAVDKQILQATADLLLKNPNAVESELVRILSKQSITHWLAVGVGEAKKMDKRTHAGLQKVIADKYNETKAKADRIDWKATRVRVPDASPVSGDLAA